MYFDRIIPVDAQTRLIEHERLAAVGQVVVGLHHGILNPLTGILGALHVLREASGDPVRRAEAITAAEEEARKIEGLVRQLAELRQTAERPYVGGITMLDIESSAAPAADSPPRPAADGGRDSGVAPACRALLSRSGLSPGRAGKGHGLSPDPEAVLRTYECIPEHRSRSSVTYTGLMPDILLKFAASLYSTMP